MEYYLLPEVFSTLVTAASKSTRVINGCRPAKSDNFLHFDCNTFCSLVTTTKNPHIDVVVLYSNNLMCITRLPVIKETFSLLTFSTLQIDTKFQQHYIFPWRFSLNSKRTASHHTLALLFLRLKKRVWTIKWVTSEKGGGKWINCISP